MSSESPTLMVDIQQAKKPKVSEGIRDLVAGVASGFAHIFSGHPLDTVKVRMQLYGKNFWPTFSSMIK